MDSKSKTLIIPIGNVMKMFAHPHSREHLLAGPVTTGFVHTLAVLAPGRIPATRLFTYTMYLLRYSTYLPFRRLYCDNHLCNVLLTSKGNLPCCLRNRGIPRLYYVCTLLQHILCIVESRDALTA